MKTNQSMSVKIGSTYTVKIGHLTKIGKLNDVLEIGNIYREKSGLRAIETREWLTKENTWEFIIKVFNEEMKKSNSHEPSFDIASEISAFPRDTSNRIAFGEVLKTGKFNLVIKSQRGGKPENRGYWANIYILLNLIDEFGINFDVEENIYKNYLNLTKQIKKFSTNRKKQVQNIYLLTDGVYFKIGIAQNVKSRIDKLQSGNPNKIKKVFSFLLNDALNIEKELHKKFENKRMNSEWFNLTKLDIQKVKNYLEKKKQIS